MLMSPDSKKNEYNLLIASHKIVSYLLEKKAENTYDEIIFIDFRPFYLSKQRQVYEFMLQFQCSICMYDKYKEHLVQQHNINHPPLCSDCFIKLTSCPFCRIAFNGKKNTIVIPNQVIRLLSYR